MKSLFRNAAFWGVVVVTLLTSLPVWAQMTQTITLKSGTGGAVGSQDPENQFTPDGGATWQYPFVICPPCSPSNICNGVYNQIPGTQYISRTPNGEGAPDSASTLYQTTFTLPAGFSAPSLTVQVYADNVATIFLNGTQIGQQPFVEYPPNFQGGPPSSFTTTEQSLFGAGVNSSNSRFITTAAAQALITWPLFPSPQPKPFPSTSSQEATQTASTPRARGKYPSPSSPQRSSMLLKW